MTTRSTWSACTRGRHVGRDRHRIFATKASTPTGHGLLYGDPGQVWKQIVAVVATIVLGFVMTVVILKVLDAIMGLRVNEEDEMAGLDLSQHSERPTLAVDLRRVRHERWRQAAVLGAMPRPANRPAS